MRNGCVSAGLAECGRDARVPETIQGKSRALSDLFRFFPTLSNCEKGNQRVAGRGKCFRRAEISYVSSFRGKCGKS